jgi:signal transduction histidine kinase
VYSKNKSKKVKFRHKKITYMHSKVSKFVDIASVVSISSMGFFINAMYFTFEYLVSKGNIIALVWAKPVEHALVMATIPLYMAVGYLYWNEKKNRRRLEQSNKMKDLFTDILRHDLLNPVGIIKNSVGLLEEDPDDKKLVEMIKKHTGRLEDIVKNASKLARIESLEKVELTYCDLSDYIREAIEEMEPLAREKEIEIIQELDGVFPAKCNPIFKDVITNLLSNAIKYSPNRSKVTVAIKDFDGEWKIMVKDNGPGIPDEYKESIFYRFTRREKGGTKGIGLGLSIVRGIVSLHGGRVWVEDNILEVDERGYGKTKKQGSIFCVALPKAH